VVVLQEIGSYIPGVLIALYRPKDTDVASITVQPQLLATTSNILKGNWESILHSFANDIQIQEEL